MNKIELAFKKLGEIKQDKLLHYIFGAEIMAIISILFMLFLNPYISILVGFLFSDIVSFLKEYIWDKKMGHGVFSKEDLYYGIAGSLSESLIFLLVVILV